MDKQTDEHNFSPFHRTWSSIRAAPQKEKLEGKEGKEEEE